MATKKEYVIKIMNLITKQEKWNVDCGYKYSVERKHKLTAYGFNVLNKCKV